MSTAYGPQDQEGAAAEPGYGAGQLGYGAVPPPPPPPMWTDYPAPGPGRHGGHGRPGRRTSMLAAGVAAVALAAGGAAWATSGSGATELSTTAIVKQTDPGVVDITSTIGYQQATAEGTGMVLSSNGIVLTNNHVVAGATSVKVRDIGNGRTYTAQVLGYSDTRDVAVLKLAGATGLPTVTVGNSGSVAIGQKVVALGNAGGRGGTPSVVTGKVTGTGAAIAAVDQGDGTVEHLTDMIRTNANIEPGDSGGPLLNSAGQVIGMDTAASTSNSGGYGTTAQQTTAAFSIPINRALSIAHQIEAGQSSSTVHIGATGFLGVQVTSGGGAFGQGGTGVAVAGVVPGMPAANAGLSGGDTIIAVGGHQVTSDSDLQKIIQLYHPGNKVSIEWADQYGQTHTSTVRLAAGPTG